MNRDLFCNKIEVYTRLVPLNLDRKRVINRGNAISLI